MRTTDLDEILRFVIRKEADAAAFYHLAAARSHPGVKKAFEELAREEEGHKRKLETVDPKKMDRLEVKETKGMGLAEMMEDVPYRSDLSYAELLRMAIKNEEKSCTLYRSMAQGTQDPGLKKVFLLLAQEESTHQERLEKIYDKEILKEF